ncbi:MAG: glycosyltransferase family 9 protein [Alphaproteobacteria bacterium]|nr:glycosyltransferase family 9 protein [Alphaproteobacteria bacterium]
MSGARTERILVIKLGALGDFVQALGPMQAIRAHHAGAHLVLLTQKAYADFARASNLFDEVWIDSERPKAWQVGRVMRLRRKLKTGNFDRVYDLQTSDRSSFYFHILGPGRRPEWCGVARGCSHPHDNPDRDRMHTVERQRDQLARAGIPDAPAPDLSWADGDVSRFGVQPPFALLVPGGAPHRPAKRWAPERYGALAARVLEAGITPVLLGARAEFGSLAVIACKAPGTVNLCDRTSFADIAALARQADLAVGNDTGPMHLIAAAGCPSVVLYSHDSDPRLCAQRGPGVVILRRESLEDLSVDEVWKALGPAVSG